MTQKPLTHNEIFRELMTAMIEDDFEVSDLKSGSALLRVASNDSEYGRVDLVEINKKKLQELCNDYEIVIVRMFGFQPVVQLKEQVR